MLRPIGASSGTADASVMARAGAVLFGLGATIGLVSLALPSPGRSEPAILAAAISAYGLAALNLAAGDRFPLWAFSALTAAGTALISVALFYGGANGTAYRLLYFWVVLYASYFFSPAHVLAQIGVIAAGVGTVLALHKPAGSAMLIWFILVSTLGIAGGLVVALRARLERLLASEREQVQRLQELDRLKDEVIATVSHELRTPLAAVYGAALTLRRRTLPEEQRTQLLEIVNREADRLARFVNDILWTSHLADGRIETELMGCAPRELAEEIVASMRTHMPANVSVTVKAPDEIPLVEADADQLRQVLVNLVDNAVKYSPDGGDVEIALEPNRDRVRFVVRDEGLGIPPEEQERIFERFHRLDPNLSRGVPGTGLGLFIARQLLRRMRGEIRVRSKPGSGSEFSFELPVAAGPRDEG